MVAELYQHHTSYLSAALLFGFKGLGYFSVLFSEYFETS